ncbi:small heat shock protein [Chiua virens]|nr:small heat shock protein [Chiua virens]
MSSLIRFHCDPFNHIFDDAFNSHFRLPALSTELTQRSTSTNPNSNCVTVTFELPGLESEDITIDIHNNRLIVSGESMTSNSHSKGGYTVRERRYGMFSRTLQLPSETKPEDVQAKMEHGLLTVTFPNDSQAATPANFHSVGSFVK